MEYEYVARPCGLINSLYPCLYYVQTQAYDYPAKLRISMLCNIRCRQRKLDYKGRSRARLVEKRRPIEADGLAGREAAEDSHLGQLAQCSYEQEAECHMARKWGERSKQ
ncbi:unnamed protein product [Nippostrongylus brasiliensis]|uniref:Uncharacterized protein n=1 Tax=Nippostrongylus brasiliensis TaxID=27835 RepID=A0A0N4XDP0_NIPBR|nr:unnamed protein product [Nippostrongylus brasiliensis]